VNLLSVAACRGSGQQIDVLTAYALLVKHSGSHVYSCAYLFSDQTQFVLTGGNHAQKLILPPSSFIRHGGTWHGLPNDTLTNYLLYIISLMIINL